MRGSFWNSNSSNFATSSLSSSYSVRGILLYKDRVLLLTGSSGNTLQ